MLAGLAAAVAMAVGAGAAGFWYGQAAGRASAPTVKAVATLQTLIRQQRSAIHALKEESAANLDALGLRLGQLQAEVLRLDALGERLVGMARLSPKEFDFGNPPPMGGPVQAPGTHTQVAELPAEMSRLFHELDDRDGKLGLLERIIMERRLDVQTTPAGRPVRSGYVTSSFGSRRDPINGRTVFHSGVDFAGERGSDVVAVADGLVIFSGERSGYGRTVEIRHGNGLVTRYAHNQKILVKEGDLVKKGQTIAALGSTGRTTGPHVHFEVLKDGDAVDPMKYVGIDGLAAGLDRQPVAATAARD